VVVDEARVAGDALWRRRCGEGNGVGVLSAGHHEGCFKKICWLLCCGVVVAMRCLISKLFPVEDDLIIDGRCYCFFVREQREVIKCRQ
jgi:hypothetical protein